MVRTISRLPYPAYAIPARLLTLAGAASSFYLAYIHFKNYSDITFASICAISQSINCDTVAQSSYSILFSVPLGIWSLLYFLFLFVISLQISPSKYFYLWWVLFFLGIAGSLFSLYLGYISATQIRSFCIFCMLNYCFILLFTFYSWIILQRFGPSEKPSSQAVFTTIKNNFSTRYNLSVLFLFFFIAGALPFAIPRYWEFAPPIPDTTLPSGVTEQGNPWIGAVDPEISIVEFSDYICFQCYKMHTALRNLIGRYPEKIRLTHINFPLDHTVNPIVGGQPYHVGAGKMALLAEYAKNQGKFWEMNDLLYRLGRKLERLDLYEIGRLTNLDADELARALNNENYYANLRRDIALGLHYGISATPTYLVNGQIHIGVLPADLFTTME